MFYSFVVTGIVGVILLAFCELLIHLKVVKGEFARKFVHIVIALFAATWAYYLSSTVIVFISLILVCIVILVKRYKLLQSFRAVNRVTYGEIWFPLGIGVSAIMFLNPDVYAVAILHMGLADGMAAVIGVYLGKRAGQFKIRGSIKSIAGTSTFIAVSFGIYLAFWTKADSLEIFSQSLPLAVIISLSSAILVATVEVLAPKGSDNIAVPVVAGVLAVLPSLQIIL